jgi:minor extracellular serine protease Vpr
MKIRTITGALAAGALVLAGVATATDAAQANPHAKPRFDRVPGLKGTTFRPAAANGDKQVKVIFQMSDQPVIQRVAHAKRQGHTFTARQRSSARSTLKQQQRSLTRAVGAAGGVVYETYQDAYNGVAARVAVKDLPALQETPGVVAVHAVHAMKINDIAGNQYIGGPQAWQNTGRTGAGVKVAIIDTGVDYTHADFGGPGTEAAFEANDPTVIEPGSFPTAKVVGGFDFVGDDYAAEADDPANRIPHPDPDPLDCNGHGSHVAGIAAGQGVLSDGSTYTGPYDANTLSGHNWNVGPGIAPKALIYAYKVFGCEGSVDNSIVVAALNRAAQDGVDVVNMSLGSPFGTPNDPEVAAVNAMAQAGTVVVTSAGNEGQNAYMVGSPSTADRAISVAALDASRATVPGAHATFSKTPATVDLQDSNEAPFPEGQTLPVKVLRNADGTVSLGCDPAEYTKAGVTGALVVTARGTCARVARAIFGQQAGAAAVVMINSDAAYPPMEGEITENPDTGEPFHVTIPFFGAPGTAAAATALQAAHGGTVTLTHTSIANPGYQRLASFTSGGPRNGDSAVKPDVTAPGVAVLSAGVGTGTKAATISGTSQAAPATAGSAALLTQAHPTWSTARIKAAIMNTADASLDLTYNPRISGTGVVQVQRAIDTQADILAGNGQSTLSYGAEQLTGAYSETLPMTIENTGATPLTYSIAGSFNGSALGAAISASPSTVTVAAGSSQTVQVTLSLSAAQVAALPNAEASNFGALVAIRGAVVATPTTSGPGVYSLRVPFLVAPRATSGVSTSETAKPRPTPGSGSGFATSVTVHDGGFRNGNADVYSWGISDPADADTPYDVRAAGVQVLPGEALGGDESDRSLVFAVNVHRGWSTPAASEVDVPIDNNGDGTPDAWVIGIDFGAATAGDNDGRYVSLITDAEFNVVDAWVATAPMNTSTMELPTLASEVGLSAGKSAFTYGVTAFDTQNGAEDPTGTARFDAWSPAVSTGEFESLNPGETAKIDLAYRQGAVSSSKVKGWMVVTLDDPSGTDQADLVAVPNGPKP